jgi:hypothetical protein
MFIETKNCSAKLQQRKVNESNAQFTFPVNITVLAHLKKN